MFELLYSSGLRLAELVALDVGDGRLDLRQAEVTVTGVPPIVQTDVAVGTVVSQHELENLPDLIGRDGAGTIVDGHGRFPFKV